MPSSTITTRRAAGSDDFPFQQGPGAYRESLPTPTGIGGEKAVMHMAGSLHKEAKGGRGSLDALNNQWHLDWATTVAVPNGLSNNNVNGNGNGNSTEHKVWQWRSIIGFLMVLVLVVVVVVGVILGTTGNVSNTSPKGGEEESTAAPIPIPVALGQIFENPSEELPAETLVAIQYGTEKDPRAKAFQWLLADPNLSLFSKPQIKQRLALAIFYFATNGPNWFLDTHDHDNSTAAAAVTDNQWLEYQTHECSWFSLAPAQGRSVCHNFTTTRQVYHHCDYTSLVLTGNTTSTSTNTTSDHDEAGIMTNPSLKGTLAPEVAMLTSLQRLDVGVQRLKGSIPPELETLSTLKEIVLYDNLFTGTIPPSFYAHTRQLWLSYNPFEPSFIPPIMMIGSELTSLALNTAQITNSIPSQLFSLNQLEELYLGNNQIDQVIPTEIGLLATSLKVLELQSNHLSSSLPTEIGLLTQLQSLRVDSNRLSGELPSQLGNLVNLQSLLLMDNQFTGTIISELAKLSELQHLKLSSWQFPNSGLEGTIPREFFVVASNNSNDNYNNSSDGDGNATRDDVLLSPPWPHLKTLWLSSTGLSATTSIPSEVGLLTSLQELWLGGWNDDASTPGKSTTGNTIPTQIGNLRNLRDLSLAECNLISTVPTELGLLSNLRFLRLEDNSLTGELPVDYLEGLAPSLEVFTVGGNADLTGTVSDAFCGIHVLDIGCGRSTDNIDSTSLCGCFCPCPKS